MKTFEGLEIKRPALDPKAVGNLVRGQVDRYYNNYDYAAPAIGNTALSSNAEMQPLTVQPKSTETQQEAGYL